ncbi:Endoplasmic reticulum metallopeptidase, partial [Thalictrum thalictroides]
MKLGIRLNSEDISGFKCLISLSILYGIISVLVYSILHMNHITPLDLDAPLDRFSEARAIEHIRVLSEEIDGRQEGRPGLKQAAEYIKSQLEALAKRAGSNIRIEIEETVVNGSFSMMFLHHSLSFAYRNHTNILMRISPADSQDTDASLLVNGHFDGPLGSPGAADCASCVASMIEVARLTIDSEWVPPRPIIFLFNGAEELFLLGSHGFMKTNKWHSTVGAFINLEASGTGSLDLVCQSGPGSWPSLVYAQSAIHPMAHSAAQDVFPVIPGDTDYRIFAEDDGNIPGLDIIFLLGGYFYHTSYDTVERLLPGSIQARGENLFSLIRAFTNSSKLKNAHERSLLPVESNEIKDRAVFFDYLSWIMIFYSRREAIFYHSLPIVIFLLAPFYLRYPNIGVQCMIRTTSDFFKGMLFHTIGVILAAIVPVLYAILRLLLSSYTMSWFAHPYLAFLNFVPCSLIGLLIPRTFWRHFPLSQDVSALRIPEEILSDEARFWGAFGLYAFITLVYLVAGLSGGFLTFLIMVSMIPAKICLCLLNKIFGRRSVKPTMGYVLILVPTLTYSVYFGGFLVQFLIEKMGMMGSLPQPYGYFVPDIIVAAVIGLVTGFCVGPLLPVVGHWLARPSILQFLLHFCVLVLALSSQFFPYNMGAPKRLVLQHTFVTSGVT